MADQSSPSIEIVARLRDEVSSGLEKLRQNILDFAKAAQPSASQFESTASDLAKAVEEASKRIDAGAKVVRDATRSAGAAAPGGGPDAGVPGADAQATKDATAALEQYIDRLRLVSAELTLTNNERAEANLLQRAEVEAKRQGIELSEQQRAEIVAEARARQTLIAQRAQEAAESIRSQQINVQAGERARQERERELRDLREAIIARDAERQAQERSRTALDQYVEEIRNERSILKLDANEREIVIAQRKAEALAVRAGIADREKFLALIRQEVQENQRARQARGEVSPTAVLASIPGASGLSVNLQQGADQAKGLASALGLSTEAAGQLAVAGAGLAVIGGALAVGVKQALELEDALRVAVVRSREVAEQSARVREIAVEISTRNVASLGESGRAISEAFLSGARNLEESAALTRAASDAAVLGFGSLEESVRRVDAVNDAFQINMRESAQTVREVFVAAQAGEAPAGAFAEALGRVGVIANQAGVPLRDTAAVLSVITRAGVDTGEAAAGLSNFLLRLANPLDASNRRLRALGVEASRAAIEQRGLIAVIRDIQRVVEERPDLANELFGSPRVARAAFTAIEDGGKAARETILAMQDSATTVGPALDRGLNEPGQRIARTWTIAKNNLLSLGDVAVSVLDRISGTTGKIIPDVEPSEVKDARRALADAIAADDPEAVRRIAEGLQKSIDAAISQITPDQAKVDELLSKLAPGTDAAALGIKGREQVLAEARRVVEEAKRTGQVAGVSLTQAESILGDMLGVTGSLNPQLVAVRTRALATADALQIVNEQLRNAGRDGVRSFGEIGKAATAGAAEAEKAVGKLRDEFAQLLSGIEVVRLRVEPQVEPEAVTKARETVKKLGSLPKDALNATETQALQEAVAVLQQYGGTLTKVQELSRRLSLDSVSGIERENLARAQAALSISDEIDALERQGVKVEELRRRFRTFRAEQDAVANAKIGQQRGSGEAERLAVLAANAQKAADLARASGDVARADELDRRALEAKATAARAAFDVQQQAAIEAVRGSALLLPAVLAINAAKSKGLDIDEEAARLALETSKQRRDESIKSEIDRARTATLQGLQGEIAGIRLAQEEYRKSIVLRVQKGELDETNARRLIRLNRERAESEIDATERAASLSVSQEILRLEGELSTTFEAQLLAKQGLIKLDQQSIREAAVKNQATEEELALLDKLFAKQLARPKLELDLQRSFGSSNLPEIVLRGRIEFEQSIVDAQVSEEAARASAELEERLRGIDQTSPEFQQAVSAMQERLEAFRDSVERANASLGRGFQLGVQQSVRELGNDTTLGLQLARDSIQAFTSNAADALTTLENGLARGKVSIGSFVASLARDLQQAINRIIAFKIVSSIFGSIGGDGYQLPGTLIGRPNAKGNVYSAGDVIPFASGAIFNGPTTFPIRGGKLGLLGEAGPEAIMPLTRGRDGKLGVRSQGGGGGQGLTVHAPITFTVTVSPTLNAIDARSGAEFLHSHAKDLANITAEQLNEQLSARVVEAVRRAAR